MNREFLPQLFVLIFSVVVIGGCTANSPKPAETGVMKNPSATTDRQSAAQPPVKLNQGTAGSSLDALRSGKSPASGPLK